MNILLIDPKRKDLPETGIFVRAKDGDRWVSADIVHLDTDSLVSWLTSRDSINFPIQVVKALLGHETP